MLPFHVGFFHLVKCGQVSSMSFHCLIAYFFVVQNNMYHLGLPQFIHSIIFFFFLFFFLILFLNFT